MTTKTNHREAIIGLGRVVVLGASGGLGDAFARTALAKGHGVRVLARDPERLSTDIRMGCEVVVGDANNTKVLEDVTRDASVVLHAINLPYPDWDPAMRELSVKIANATFQNGATLLFPGNVYGLKLGSSLAEEGSEATPALSKKGALRRAIEEDLQTRAKAQSGQVIVLRAGDFFGGIGDKSWNAALTEDALKGKAIRYGSAKLDTPHAWAYLPDFVAALLELAQKRASLSQFEVFHFEGHTLTGRQWADAVREALGDPERPVKPLAWHWFGLLRPFVPMIRELWEMRYLFDEELTLSGDKLRAVLPALHHTPLPEAMAHALELQGLERSWAEAAQ